MKVNYVGIAPYPQSYAKAHIHDEWEIILNLEGYGIARIGNKQYEFAPGTITCIPPGVSHYKSAKGKFKDIFLQVDDLILPTRDTVPVFSDDEESTFEALMFMALRVFYKKNPNYRLILESIYETMRQLLISWCGDKPKNQLVELFKNEIIVNFSNPDFQIAQAIQKTGYCKDYFRRCFKKETGVTPVSYLMNLRIEYAKKLLSQSSDRKPCIADVSLMSGFYDSRYFSRVFKKVVGVTPLEYRS